MSARSHELVLPIDLILNVIDFIIPAPKQSPVALSRHHPITKTIISLTLTCRAIYPTAHRLLYTHCLHISTPRQLNLLLDTLAGPSDPTRLSSTNGPLLTYITSLYLSVSVSFNYVVDLTIVLSIRRLFSFISPYIRRLVIDLPFRRYFPDDTASPVRQILRSAFSDFPVLEEFCSICDELCLDLYPDLLMPREEPFVWSFWPRLKTLALYNVDVSTDRFWDGLRKLNNLETVVLTRSDGLNKVDIKREWRKKFDEEIQVKALDVVLVNVEAEHQVPMGSDEWKENDVIQVRDLDVPTSYYGDDDVITLCQQWVMRRILQGEPVVNWS